MILQPTSLTPELTCVAFYMSSTPVTLLVFVGHFLTLVICGQKVHVERQSLAGESFHLSAPRFGRCELRSASRMAKKKPMDSSTDPENQILYAQKYSFSFLLHIKFQFFGNTQ